MYVKIPYKNPKPVTKLQAIRQLKSDKWLRKYCTCKKMVKYLQDRRRFYSVLPYKNTGVYMPMHPEGDLLNISNHLECDVINYTDLLSGESFGVCDDVENFLEVYNEELENSDRKFFAILTPVLKSDQPRDGGWRWHKWGRYIGKFEPECEYLCDEKDIEIVYLFHIYEVI